MDLRLNQKQLVDSLRQLNSREEQLRLWCGPSNSRWISSFVEAACGIGDSGLIDVLENEPSSLHPEVASIMIEVNKALRQVEEYGDPLVIIESEQMQKVRELAGEALSVIYRVGLDLDGP